MNDEVSEIIKDLSEALLAIVSSICLIIKTKQSIKSKKSKSRKGKRWGKPHLPFTNYNIPHSSILYKWNL